MWKVSLHYLQNWQNYAAFCHVNLAVETLSRIASTIEDGTNAVSANTVSSRDKCLECLPSPFTYSCQTTCQTLDRSINWTCGKMFHIFSSTIFNSETVLGFGWRLQNSFMHAPQTRYIHSIQIWRVIRWPLFLFKHLWTVLLEALTRAGSGVVRIDPLRFLARCRKRWLNQV